MAAPVVAQHAERARQRFGLRVPHAQVGAEGIAESQPRPALAVDAVVQAVAGQVEERHRPQTRSNASPTPMPTPPPSVARPRLKSEERRAGNECVSTLRSRGYQITHKK